jgi:hypothetical protein
MHVAGQLLFAGRRRRRLQRDEELLNLKPGDDACGAQLSASGSWPPSSDPLKRALFGQGLEKPGRASR